MEDKLITAAFCIGLPLGFCVGVKVAKSVCNFFCPHRNEPIYFQKYSFWTDGELHLGFWFGLFFSVGGGIVLGTGTVYS